LFEVLRGGGDTGTEVVCEMLRRVLDALFDEMQGGAHARLLDLRRRRRDEVFRKAGGTEPADEPLRRIEVVPAKAVAEVGGEAVVEAVKTLAEADERDQPVVPRRDLGVVDRLSGDMRQRVHEEGRVVDDDDPEEPAPEKAGERVAEHRADQRRNPETG